MSDEIQHNRRATDRPEVVERVVALEMNVNHVRDAMTDLATDLRGHIADEAADLGQVMVAVERLNTTSDAQTRTLEKVVETLQTVAVHSSRVQALEVWREKTEVRLDDTTTKVSVIYKVVAAIVVIAPAIWAVFHQTGVLK